MRTLVPKSLWSCLSQPIPGSTRAEHKAMLGLALEEHVKHLDKAVHQAHDWLCWNPLPWDPILWVHPSDPLNPFSASHGAFSTSIHMPPRTRPAYQHPPPLPKHALKKPSKLASAKAQPATRRAPKKSKRPPSCASAPRPPPPSRPFPALLSTHTHGNQKSAIDHHKPIRPQSFGRPRSAPRPLPLSHPQGPRQADLPCGGGGGFRKAQRADGVERRGQKVAGFAGKISDVPVGAGVRGGRGRRTWAPGSAGPRGER